MMPALNFQIRFATMVQKGTKRQTIRALRKRPIKAGDTLYLYTGQRRPGTVKLGEAVCREVQSISIWRSTMRYEIRVDGRPFAWNGCYVNEIAQEDGFMGALEMLRWFERTHGLPFVGQLIRW